MSARGGWVANTAAVLNILVTANTGPANAALARTQAQLMRTQKTANSSASATKKSGLAAAAASKGAAAGVVVLGAAMVASVKIGMDFEKGLSSLGAVADATAGEMEKLK